VSDLEIPERAYDAGRDAIELYDMGDTSNIIDAAAPIIVAAELRRLTTSGLYGVVTYDHLRRRADELDPPEGRAGDDNS
jgi:hypothetical protein